MESWNCSPQAATVSHTDVDPYRLAGADAFLSESPGISPRESGDTNWPPIDAHEQLLAHSPAPDPRDRVARPVRASVRRRLDLHATLTVAGVAPAPGDLRAIDELSLLDDETNLALQRWITSSR
ncbi:hypothetical protein ACFWU3_22855 [Streptomyces sp. NPDC058685]|uniref:hypothetical protein n=1 Tax=Streptomyces sp. NPDC058685 TaxID=3346598 RepID=UPI003657C0A4